ncbi:MAG: FtsQ-type POTRA domain-containing protein [Treponema sp.]|jgi:cell division protein FtsQ|nr:FtsQ-type POTRA domain-containing protein [Treponema sp.]
MSDDIFKEDLLDGQKMETSASGNSSKIEKVLRWVIIVALIILGGELVVILAVNPCLPLSKVEVMGMPELDKEAVLEKAGITGKSSYISVNPRTTERRLKTFLEVESVKVSKRFPDSVRITLEGRKAIAMSFGMIDGKVYPVFFDKQGLVFMIGTEDTKAPPPFSIPIISGLMPEQPFLGMRLPAMFNTLLSDLEMIRISAPELLAVISEIRVNRNVFDGYDLILYPVHNRVRIRLGTELNENMLRYVMLVVDVCVARGAKIEEIDFRTGTASYTIKEASSG